MIPFFTPGFDDLHLLLKLVSPGQLFAGLVLSAIAVVILLVARSRTRIVARLKGVTWRRHQFCRGWLITGDTGSGKTSSGINQLAHQVFKNVPTWGGLCIDDKGVYWETL